LDWVERHFLKSVALAVLTLCLLLCLVVYNVSNAADVRVSWTQPLTNTDSSSIPASGPGSISQNRVQWGTCVGSAFGTQIGVQTIPAATSYVVTALPPAVYCFRVYAINTYGETSLASNVTTKTVVAPVPNPPVVTSATVVRLLQPNKSLGAVAGTIPLHTPCNALAKQAKSAAWHYVSRTSVKLNSAGRKSSLPVVAKCA